MRDSNYSGNSVRARAITRADLLEQRSARIGKNLNLPRNAGGARGRTAASAGHLIHSSASGPRAFDPTEDQGLRRARASAPATIPRRRGAKLSTTNAGGDKSSRSLALIGRRPRNCIGYLF